MIVNVSSGNETVADGRVEFCDGLTPCSAEKADCCLVSVSSNTFLSEHTRKTLGGGGGRNKCVGGTLAAFRVSGEVGRTKWAAMRDGINHGHSVPK